MGTYMDFNYYTPGSYEPGYSAIRSLAPIKPSLFPDYVLGNRNNQSKQNATANPHDSWQNPVQDSFRRLIDSSRMSGSLSAHNNLALNTVSVELPPIKRLYVPDLRRSN